MNPSWRQYRQQIGMVMRTAPFGVLFGLIPFALNAQRGQSAGAMWRGLALALTLSGIITATICVIFLIAFAALGLAARRFGWRYVPGWKFYVVTGACGMIVGVSFGLRLQDWYLGRRTPDRWFIQSLVWGAVATGAFGLYHLYQETRAEMLSQRAALADARLHVLETQLRPHFLFNALNSLAELIESRREDAAETAYTLADLYRTILANSKRRTAPLESELAVVRDYLNLEKLRFGDRLTFSMAAPDDPADIFLPSLALLTLVENAVKHGIARSVVGGTIEISVVCEPDGYRATVANSGAPLRETESSGTGLVNTRERLDLLYGDRHGFELRQENGRTVAQFHFSGASID